MVNNAHPPIIVLGAPRSGTSLIAGILHHCNVSMGANLLESDTGNPQGYFEDLDFIDFHRQLLARSAGSVGRVFEDSTMREQPFDFDPTPADISTAKEFIHQRNAQQTIWGWKDPRTCLFLPFWQQLLPDARFILAYKHPLEMSASLLRMGKNWDLCLDPLLAVRSWTFYMSEALQFIQQLPDDQYFVANTNALINNLTPLLTRLKTWGISQIDETALNAHILPELTTKSILPDKVQQYFAHHFPEATQIFEQLQGISSQPLKPTSKDGTNEPTFPKAWNEQIDSTTALSVLQNITQPTAADKNNRMRSELQQTAIKLIRYRFAQETKLKYQLHTLEISHKKEAEQFNTAQQQLQTTQQKQLNELAQAHRQETDQVTAQLQTLEQTYQHQTQQFEATERALENTIQANETKLGQQALALSDLNQQLSQAQQFRDIIEHCPETTTRYDAFGRARTLKESPCTYIRRWQLKRATLTNWEQISKKAHKHTIWIIDLFSLLQQSTTTSDSVLQPHWEQVSTDISRNGCAGQIQPRTTQHVFTSIQADYFNTHPQAPIIPLEHTYNELAAKFKVPDTVSENWMRHRALTLGQSLHPSTELRACLGSLNQQGSLWACSGVHGFQHDALITFIEALKLPTPPVEYLAPQKPERKYSGAKRLRPLAEPAKPQRLEWRCLVGHLKRTRLPLDKTVRDSALLLAGYSDK